MQDILASLSQTQTQSQRTSDIIKRYPNINVPKSYRSHHEEGAPRNIRPSNEEAGKLNFLLYFNIYYITSVRYNSIHILII